MSYADGEKPQVGDILKTIADTGELSIGTKTKVTNVAFGGNLIQVDKSYKDKSFLVKIGDQCLACVSEDVVIISYKCDCNVDVLMSQGCKCGGS